MTSCFTGAKYAVFLLVKAETDLLHYLTIGIGINVNLTTEDFPPDLKILPLPLPGKWPKNPRLLLARNVLQEMDKIYERYVY